MAGRALSNGNPEAGTADWWLHILVTDLLHRLPLLKRRGDYVDGYHALPTADRRYLKAYGHLQSICSTNYCGLVTNAAVQRMNVRGFQFGDGDGLDPDARQIWNYNDMDMQSTSNNQYAAKYGLGYMLVEAPDPLEETDFPSICVLDPRTAITYQDPTRPTRALAGLRMWADDLTGHVMAVVYTREGVFPYMGAENAILVGATYKDMREILLGVNGGPGAFEMSGSPVPNEIGIVPMVEFQWRPQTGAIPESEASVDVRIIQDRLNQTVFDRVAISATQAYKQRWVSGLKTAEKKDGQRKAPFDPGSDKLWVTESETAKFGEFTSADVTQILDAIRDDVSDIAAITQTPSHYLMGKVANVSGETLALAETGLVQKIKQRCRSMGWSYETVMKIAFAYMGDDRATSVEACVIWNDPEQNALTDQAAAAAQFIASGIPAPVTMERVGGFTEDQIAFTQEQVELQKQQDAEMQQQQLEMAQQQTADGSVVAQATAKQKTAPPGNPRTASNGGGNPRPKKSASRPPK